MKRIVKMYEDFKDVPVNIENKWKEEKDKIFTELKSESEEIIKQIGVENEKTWFDLLNKMSQSEDDDSYEVVMNEINEFLTEFGLENPFHW